MPESNADGFPPYGPVPDEIRKPLIHRDPPHLLTRPLPSRPIPDLRPAGQDHKLLLNKSTAKEQPNRATGVENKSLKKYPGVAPEFERRKPPSFEELKEAIDEEQSNRLNWMDGYTGSPPKPREGFGLQLRPQHDDINEYFTGPKWHDPNIRNKHPFVESAASRPPQLLGPQMEHKREVQYRKEGEWVRRPEPPPPLPKKLPAPAQELPLFRAKIRFESMNELDLRRGTPAKFAGREFLDELNRAAKFLRENPRRRVEIRASVGLDWLGQLFPPSRDVIEGVMTKRAEAVIKQLEVRGIDPSRMQTGFGKVGTGEDDRIVDFVSAPPAH
jgi:hypothetical protein